MNFLAALRALEQPENAERGIRHPRWRAGVRLRWRDGDGWQWSTLIRPAWSLLPLSAFFEPGAMGAPVLLDDRWEIV